MINGTVSITRPEKTFPKEHCWEIVNHEPSIMYQFYPHLFGCLKIPNEMME